MVLQPAFLFDPVKMSLADFFLAYEIAVAGLYAQPQHGKIFADTGFETFATK